MVDTKVLKSHFSGSDFHSDKWQLNNREDFVVCFYGLGVLSLLIRKEKGLGLSEGNPVILHCGHFALFFFSWKTCLPVKET